jgi:ribosomal protein S13
VKGLTRIRKPCGESENFDRNRLVQSIRSAGVTERTAASVVDRIRLSEDISTEELTRLVAEHLRRVNPALSGTYMATENLKVRAAQDVSAGVAQIPENLVKRFRMSPGQRVNVTHLNSRTEMAVEPAKSVDPREIHLSRTDVYKLGAHEGAKVVVTFPH